MKRAFKMNPGHIYILQNPSFPEDLLKIGKTTRTPIERAKELSSNSGVPTEFNVVFDIFTPDCNISEKEVHEELKKYRVTTNREFFKLAIDTAKEVIITVVTEHIENEVVLLEETIEDRTLQFKNELENEFLQFKNELKNEIVEKKKYIEKIKPVKQEKPFITGYNQPVWFDYPFIKHDNEEELEVYEARRTAGTQRVVEAQKIVEEQRLVEQQKSDEQNLAKEREEEEKYKALSIKEQYEVLKNEYEKQKIVKVQREEERKKYETWREEYRVLSVANEQDEAQRIKYNAWTKEYNAWTKEYNIWKVKYEERRVERQNKQRKQARLETQDNTGKLEWYYWLYMGLVILGIIFMCIDDVYLDSKFLG